MPETIPVREGEGFDHKVVERYLRKHIDGLPELPLEVEQFPAGHSNLTYLLTMGDWQAVLRRPPLGPVAPKAHDMERECNLLEVVHPYVTAAPKPFAYCADSGVIGAPFYVMQRLSGVVIDDAWPSDYPDSAAARRQVSETMVTTLAELHKLTSDVPGLSRLGRPEGYMQRQVAGWIKRHQLAATDDEIPGVREVGQWLEDNLPSSSTGSLIHNDFKLNNILLDPQHVGMVTGVVDWEMSTVGDPLSDLAIAMSYWAQRGDPPVLRKGLSPVTAEHGFLTRVELLQSYAKRANRDVANMDFYMTFAYFKTAGILQQIYYRWRHGQTQDRRFRVFGEMAKQMIEVARTTSRERQYE